ncbi:unnamed protein product [Protopolystoma xenopodis]|uniref:Uncharacterized protein n=1 Tax=Protopolystoma xenopodis TaxID=117903 RepID=A0A3S5BKB1_9PLAT|nr:unnamed protein product [Protopolystoma xenopodis]
MHSNLATEAAAELLADAGDEDVNQVDHNSSRRAVTLKLSRDDVHGGNEANEEFNKLDEDSEDTKMPPTAGFTDPLATLALVAARRNDSSECCDIVMSGVGLIYINQFCKDKVSFIGSDARNQLDHFSLICREIIWLHLYPQLAGKNISMKRDLHGLE